MSSTDTVLINESRYQNKMNELQTTIAHDSYDDQQEIPRAFNDNEGNAIISGCIPDYNGVNKPPMIISTSDIRDACDEITTWKKCFSGAIRENRKGLYRSNNDAYK